MRRRRSASASGFFETTSTRSRIIVDRRLALRQVAEEPAVAGGRPGVVQRPFHFDPLQRQSAALVFVSPDLVDGARPRQTIRQDLNARARLHVLDEFRHGRLVGRCVEITNQAAFARQRSAARRDAIGHRLAGTLKTGGRDAETIVAAVGRVERRQPDCVPGGRGEADDAIVQLAINALGAQLDLVRLRGAIALGDQFWLRPVGDGHVQGGIGRFQVLLHQEGRRVQCIADVVETVRRGIRGQLLLQVDRHAQKVVHRVLVLVAVEPAHDDAPLGGALGHRRFHFCVHPLGEGFRFLSRGTRLRLRRHLPRFDLLHHLQPAIPIGQIVEIGGDLIEAQASLGLLGAVAADAVLGE